MRGGGRKLDTSSLLKKSHSLHSAEESHIFKNIYHTVEQYFVNTMSTGTHILYFHVSGHFDIMVPE